MNIDQHFVSATRLFDELADQLGIPGDRNRAARIGERDTFSVARELPEPLVEFWMAA